MINNVYTSKHLSKHSEKTLRSMHAMNVGRLEKRFEKAQIASKMQFFSERLFTQQRR